MMQERFDPIWVGNQKKSNEQLPNARQLG